MNITLLPYAQIKALKIDVLYLTVGLVSETKPLETLKQLISEALWLSNQGVTVIVPTFSFDFCDQAYFHTDKTSSFCGLFAEQWRNHDKVFRTWSNPVHSVAVAGPLVNEVQQLSPTNTFGQGTVFDWMTQKNTLCCLWGVYGGQGISFIHYIEDVLHVPYREYQRFSGVIHDGTSEFEYAINRFMRCNTIPDLERICVDFCATQAVTSRVLSNSIVTTFTLADFVPYATSHLEQVVAKMYGKQL